MLQLRLVDSRCRTLGLQLKKTSALHSQGAIEKGFESHKRRVMADGDFLLAGHWTRRPAIHQRKGQQIFHQCSMTLLPMPVQNLLSSCQPDLSGQHQIKSGRGLQMRQMGGTVAMLGVAVIQRHQWQTATPLLRI